MLMGFFTSLVLMPFPFPFDFDSELWLNIKLLLVARADKALESHNNKEAPIIQAGPFSTAAYY